MTILLPISLSRMMLSLYTQAVHLIDESYARVSAVVNSEIAELCWQVGDAINKDLLEGKRAEYGTQVMQRLSERLTVERGRGWSVQQLWHRRRLANIFTHEILSALRRELSRARIKAIMYIDEPLKRDFYIEMCKMNNLGLRTLSGRFKSMLYERAAIAKKADEVIANNLEQ